MNSYDARWAVDDAVAAGWMLEVVVEGSREDVEAAIEDDDCATAVDAASKALFDLGHCWLMLDGYPREADETEMLSALAVRRPDILRELSELPPALSALRAEVEATLDIITAQVAELRGALPIQLPTFRTPKGMFPSIRIANEVGKIRDVLDMEEFLWITE